MKYTYSQLASESVVELLERNYDLPGSVSCRYYVLGLHDNYLVSCGERKYIFRIYRNDWRNSEEIQFELSLLMFCKQKKLNVSAPVLRNIKDNFIQINCPEGMRLGVLFDFADGRSVANSISNEHFALLGASVAKFHIETTEFETEYSRPTFEVSYLVGYSLTLIEPYLNRAQRKFLNEVKLKVSAGISPLSRQCSDYGVCMGDVNVSNFHINEKEEITHFDFDQCGYGYRAFELGKFISSLPNNDTKKGKVSSFLKGYDSVRSITDIEKEAIPYFELASLIWVMSIHAENANRIGCKYLDMEFWSRRISIIEGLYEKLPNASHNQ